ncbi:Hypothetical predicted protein [Olea europaea subsp. europaea]|uniref:CID domain-containing protein n=1 Tax=Olea europaea subsp. europaea TaxID=158383 RepID=A0A8S0U1U4_OLEEU|nr:Hypothetical predicted protein [Olea europaea subsp. europaea]
MKPSEQCVEQDCSFAAPKAAAQNRQLRGGGASMLWWYGSSLSASWNSGGEGGIQRCGMNSVFNEEILDKLSKLINTHQCIEKQVVATWDRQFQNPEMVRKVNLLYLAHDIPKNSKQNGNEFVSGFWMVLP